MPLQVDFHVLHTHVNMAATGRAHIESFKVSHALCYLKGKVVDIFRQQIARLSQVVAVDGARL